MGRAAARLGTDIVVVVGAAVGGIGEGLEAVAAWRGDGVVAEEMDEAIEWIRENVLPDDVVLVKASHGVALWEIADALLETDPEEDRAES